MIIIFQESLRHHTLKELATVKIYLSFHDNYYDAHIPHFLFTDIQLGKGKACNAQKVTMEVNGASETLWYRVAPCGMEV